VERVCFLVRVRPDRLEELRHLGLPAGVDVRRLHAGESGLEVLGLQVADEQAVIVEEQRVVAPAGGAERRQHVRPHLAVARLVLIETVRPHPQKEAHALHYATSAYSRPSSVATLRSSPA
jgi:hypothetical protein